MFVFALGVALRKNAIEESVPHANADKTASSQLLASGTHTDSLIQQGARANAGWVAVDPATVDELPVYKEIVPGRVLIRVLDAINEWEAGDEVVLGIPQLGADFDGAIERVEQDANGNRTYFGLVREVDGYSYRFVITVGPRNTFAHVGTSRGTFELVATGGNLGWLMPTANMDQHVDYTQPDYFTDEATLLWEDDDAP